jgi:MoaA/NifB/PqqE/SkfB family radical SAM enzyme
MNIRSMLISITESCNVGCDHCGFKGTPRNREVSPIKLCHWLEEIKKFGVNSITFTGGEPFGRLELLKIGVSKACELGLNAAVFTGCFWGKSLSRAKAILEQLQGLTRLYLSTDKYHQKHIPLQNVKNVINAGIGQHIDDILVSVMCSRQDEFDEIKNELKEYDSQIKFHMGRIIPTHFLKPPENDPLPVQEKASLISNRNCWIGTPLINPDGKVYACHIGKVAVHEKADHSSFYLGDLNSWSIFDIFQQASKRREYQFLRTHGPEGISRFLGQYPEVLQSIGRSDFTCTCHMCLSTLSSKQANKYFSKYINQPEIADEIDMSLVLRFRENIMPLNDLNESLH